MVKKANTALGTGGSDLQAVAPDHTNQLGTANGTGASLAVPSGSSIESDDAPKDGIVIVTFPALLTVRVRIGENATAGANDQSFIGPDTWHWPIAKDQRVSLFGDGTSGTATISMAK